MVRLPPRPRLENSNRQYLTQRQSRSTTSRRSLDRLPRWQGLSERQRPMSRSPRAPRFYVSGQPAALAALLGKSATSYASLNGEAVALVASDAPYKAISLSLSLEGLVNPYLAKVPHLSKLLATASSPASTVLSGPWTTSGPTNGWKGLTSLRIDPDTSLPRSGLVELHHGKGIATRAAVFRAWGTQPNVTAPTISVPFGSLPG